MIGGADMGAVRFGVDDLVNLRFAISPLWETVASLRASEDPGRHAVHLPWIKKAVALRQDRELARHIEPLRTELAGFDTPPPRCPLAEIEEELATAGAPREVGDAVLAWWRAAVEPHWPRIRAVLEADVVHRTRHLAEDGIQEVFAHLHPTLRWSRDRLVSVDLPPGELGLDGGGITLVPTAFATRCRLLPGRGATPPCVLYPARAVGTLWERRASADEGLARLLGRSRARVLADTSSPATTTQLAARTGLSLGAVSQHLAVLRDAGLVTSHRYGREVHYTASGMGLALLGQRTA
ncbi:ArsR family transcriptional regulator [Streptomyces sp. NPDC058301]|uniref:ArsR/SmtB family transcription factor n=1 Tax=Streptomyces sp. NPDC058301 TaxID=3346436 RepID=UPI0036EA77DA